MHSLAATGALALAYRCRVRLPRSDSLAGYLLGCEQRQLHPAWCLYAGVAVAPRCQDWRGGLRGVGRDEPPGHVFAVCDLDCQPDRSGTLRPASIASTALAWASSTSSRVARPALRRTTRPVPEWGAGR